MESKYLDITKDEAMGGERSMQSWKEVKTILE